MVKAYKWPWAHWWDIWPTGGVEGGGGSVIGRFYWEEGILGIRFILVGYKGHHVVERT